MEKLGLHELTGMFEHVAKIMSENAQLLCDMDARMGDGDLGLTMNRGFSALPEALSKADGSDIGKALMQAGMKMASVAPSTMGTLMASGIMQGGKSLTGTEIMDAAAYAVYLNGFSEGIMKRGKCAVGDRTVLDAIYPASERADKAMEKDRGASLENVAREAYEGAKDGLEATKSMIPKFGKATPFASRAEGIEDQGAFAGVLMIRGYYEYICGEY